MEWLKYELEVEGGRSRDGLAAAAGAGADLPAPAALLAALLPAVLLAPLATGLLAPTAGLAAAAFRVEPAPAAALVAAASSCSFPTFSLTLFASPVLLAVQVGKAAAAASENLGEDAGEAALASLSILNKKAISLTLLPSCNEEIS